MLTEFINEEYLRKIENIPAANTMKIPGIRHIRDNRAS
jgi:hypothetical protein